MNLNSFQMKLYTGPFELIESGKKTVEVRCYDEKRKQIKVGDSITFTKYDNPDETVVAVVEAIEVFDTFEELYSSYPMSVFGHPDASVADMVDAVNRIYSKDEQLMYGAVAITIRVIG